MSLTKIHSLLKQNPSWKVLSGSKLYKILKSKDNTISKKDVDVYLSEEPLQEVFKKPSKHIPLKITADPRSFQIDIFELPQYERYNKGTKKALLLVDVLSRKAWVYPLKTGKISDVLPAVKDFLGQVKDVNSFTGDDFFSNSSFTQYVTDQGIDVWTDIAKDDHFVKGSDKLGIIDRLTRTLKGLIKKYMVSENSVEWTKWIGKIVDLYNTTPHSSLQDLTPDDVWKNEGVQNEIHTQNLLENADAYDKMPSFDKGTVVRVRRRKGTFDKEGQTYSNDIYKIHGKEGNKYIVKDADGNLVKKKFKVSEVLKTNAHMVKDDKVQAAEKNHKDKLKFKRSGLT